MNEINTNNKNKIGKILFSITGGLALGISVICVPFVSPAFRRICLPYVPATDTQVKNVFECLKNRTGKLIDLGSGDGRIVIEAAKRNFEAHGIELNLWLVIFSKINAFRQNLKNTKFIRQNLWSYNLSSYDNIVIFGVKEMMNDLETKLLSELKNGDKNFCVVACRFPLPNLTPIKTIGNGIDTAWLYKLNK